MRTLRRAHGPADALESLPNMALISSSLAQGAHSAFGLAWRLAALIALVVTATYYLRLRYIHPLSRYRGPWLAAYTDFWKGFAMFRGHIHEDVREYHMKYGPVVRIGPNTLSVSHADVSRTIWGEGRKVPKVRTPTTFIHCLSIPLSSSIHCTCIARCPRRAISNPTQQPVSLTHVTL